MNHKIVAMTPMDLQGFIDANGIEATILSMAELTPTVVDATGTYEIRKRKYGAIKMCVSRMAH